MKLKGLNDQLMATAAHRYCLGRRSYIVGACLDWLYQTWEQFDRNTRRVMIRDTIAALMDDQAGGSYDVDGWQGFAAFGYLRLNDEDQQWVRSSVAHKGKPWPLEECGNVAAVGTVGRSG
jgi:hypothetical protein